MKFKASHCNLTTSFNSDVTGYSRLMQDDEAVTGKILEAYK